MGEMSEAADWIWFGKHRLRFEPPDVVRLEIDGYFVPEEAREYVRNLHTIGDLQGYFYHIIDMRRATGGMVPGTRSTLVRPPRPYPLLGAVGLGGNFTLRVMTTAVVRAGRTLLPKWFGFPLEFHAKEDEVQRQIDVWRKDRAARR